jgi:hypothetical protein
LRIIERGDSAHDIDSGVDVDDHHDVDHHDVDDHHRLRRTTDSGPR